MKKKAATGRRVDKSFWIALSYVMFFGCVSMHLFHNQVYVIYLRSCVLKVRGGKSVSAPTK